MFLINGQDFTDLLTTELSFSFRFPDTSQSINYLPVESCSLIFNYNDDSINPNNPYSPLYQVSLGFDIYCQYIDELNPSINRTFKILNAKVDDGEIVLTLEDSINTILQKKMVLTYYDNITPIELMKEILIQYGLDIDYSNYNIIKTFQEDNGLFFTLTIGITDEIILNDCLGKIAEAGLMKIAIYNNLAYIISLEGGIESLELLEQEIFSLPTYIEQSKNKYNGGEVNWLSGIITVAGTEQLKLNYSGTENLVLNNPSGAYCLINSYNDSSNFGKYIEFSCEKNISRQITPGSFIRLPDNKLLPQMRKCRFIGREKDIDFISEKITLEVRQWPI
jgi:hypothetical protein